MFVYIAATEPVAGFQFGITTDGELFLGSVSGSGGLSSAFDVSGGNGAVVGVDLSGANTIPAGEYDILTILVLTDGGEFPSGETCLVDIIMSDSDAMPILSVSACDDIEGICMGGSPP
eukprot:scaffold5916_cov282-Prasinococcus_capsulatus_cf.AAC.1